jgi:hypothetical protein
MSPDFLILLKLMESREFYVMNAWRRMIGMSEMPENNYIPITTFKDVKELEESEWSPKFEKLMRRRLIMGSLRYGKINGKGKPQYDYVDAIIRRAELYRKTGNQEYLVDVANCCLVEFEQEGHINAHFSSVDDTDEHFKPK